MLQCIKEQYLPTDTIHIFVKSLYFMSRSNESLVINYTYVLLIGKIKDYVMCTCVHKVGPTAREICVCETIDIIESEVN